MDHSKNNNIIRLLNIFMIVFLIAGSSLFLSGCGSSGKKDGNLNVYCFQAGKADSFLIYTDDSSVLIDCGSKGFDEPILNYLNEHGIRKLDYLIITHFDKDHVGGAAKIVKGIKIGKILQNDNEKDSKECEKYAAALEKTGTVPEIVEDSVSFTLDGASYTVTAGEEEYKKNDSNNASLVTSVTYGERKMLFTGDIQSKRIKDFMKDNTSTYDFLKVPHHGVIEKNTDNLIDSIKPEYAVITSSELEKEDDLVVTILKNNSVKVFLTRENPVLVTTDGTDMKAEYVTTSD